MFEGFEGDRVLLAWVIVLRGGGYRQSQIAETVGLSQQTVSRYTKLARAGGDPLDVVEWAVRIVRADAMRDG